MLARTLNQKPLIGANFLPPQKSARERAVERWFLKKKPPLSTTTVSDKTVPGQYFDQETGLSYNYNRTYDPRIGRYLESDPIGLDGGNNIYIYVMGNPIRYMDFFGLATQEGFTPGQWNKIQQAIANVRSTLKECINCNTNDPINMKQAEEIIKALENAHFIFKPILPLFACADSPGDTNRPGTPSKGQIQISLNGLDASKCCPLPSLLAHEGVHLIDLEPDAGRSRDAADREEQAARALELKCFGCSR